MSSSEEGDEESFDNWFDRSAPANARPGDILRACLNNYNDKRIGVAVPANYVPGHHVKVHIPPNVVPFVQAFKD